MSDITISRPEVVTGHTDVICSTSIRHILAVRKSTLLQIDTLIRQLAEISATLIAKSQKPNGYTETRRTVIDGGTIAGNARKELESKLGRSVISPLNASDPILLDEDEDKS